MNENKEPLSHFIIEPALGVVREISASSVVVDCDASPALLDSQIRIGEIIVLATHSGAALGQISTLKSFQNGKSFFQMEIRIISSLHLATGTITPGVSDLPFIGAKAFWPRQEVIQAVIEDRRSVFTEQKTKIRLQLAKTADSRDVNLSFSPEQVFGRHLAVLGTSGAGKSWSVAKIVEESSKFNSKVILIDPTGEYETLESGVFHIHVGHAHRKTKSLETSLPYKELSEADMVAIFRPIGGSQIIKLRAAMRTLKLLALEPKLATEGTFLKAHKSKVTYEAAFEHHRPQIENSKNNFDIKKLPFQIELECVDPTRSSVEPNIWGATNSYDQSQCVPLINKISDIINSEELSPIFKEQKQPPIFEALERFFKDPKVSVLRISLEFLPSTHRVREIISNSLGRYLLQHARLNRFKDQPVVIALDEAHQVLNSQFSDMSQEFPLEAFNIIAKEGRKYALTLCLATQRPRDIPEDVLSQVGTFFVHRLVNDADRSTVERASGAMHQSVLDYLPSLTPGESFILGIDFPNPIRVRIQPPTSRPNSAGPDYQRLWGI